MGFCFCFHLAANLQIKWGGLLLKWAGNPGLYMVYLRTSDAFSQAVTAQHIVFSLIMFAILYTALFLLFVYLLNKKLKAGPYDEAENNSSALREEVTQVITQNT